MFARGHFYKVLIYMGFGTFVNRILMRTRGVDAGGRVALAPPFGRLRGSRMERRFSVRLLLPISISECIVSKIN